jgi:membrane-bound acyltransferase YfiQ involved in biofilm formation
MKKLLKGYKTVILAALTAAFGAAQVALPSLQVALTPEIMGYATMVIGVAFAMLRAITDTPLGGK